MAALWKISTKFSLITKIQMHPFHATDFKSARFISVLLTRNDMECNEWKYRTIKHRNISVFETKCIGFSSCDRFPELEATSVFNCKLVKLFKLIKHPLGGSRCICYMLYLHSTYFAVCTHWIIFVVIDSRHKFLDLFVLSLKYKNFNMKLVEIVICFFFL